MHHTLKAILLPFLFIILAVVSAVAQGSKNEKNVSHRIPHSNYILPSFELDLNDVDPSYNYSIGGLTIRIQQTNLEVTQKTLITDSSFDGKIKLKRADDYAITDEFIIQVIKDDDVERKIAFSFLLKSPRILSIKFGGELNPNKVNVDYASDLDVTFSISGSGFHVTPSVTIEGIKTEISKISETQLTGKLFLKREDVDKLRLGTRQFTFANKTNRFPKTTFDIQVYSSPPNFISTQNVRFFDGKNDARFSYSASNLSPSARLFTKCPDANQNCGIAHDNKGLSIVKDGNQYYSNIRLNLPNGTLSTQFEAVIKNGDGSSSVPETITVSKITQDAELVPDDKNHPFVKGEYTDFILTTTQNNFELALLDNYELMIDDIESVVIVTPKYNSSERLTGRLFVPEIRGSKAFFELKHTDQNGTVRKWVGEIKNLLKTPKLIAEPFLLKNKEISLKYDIVGEENKNWKVVIDTTNVDLTDGNISDDGLIKFKLSEAYSQRSLLLHKYNLEKYVTTDTLFIEQIDEEFSGLITFGSPIQRSKRNDLYIELEKDDSHLALTQKDPWIDQNREFQLQLKATKGELTISNRTIQFKSAETIEIPVGSVSRGETFNVRITSPDNKVNDELIVYRKKGIKPEFYLGLSGARYLLDEPKADTIPRWSLLSGINVGAFSSFNLGFPTAKDDIGLGLYVSAFEKDNKDINFNLGVGVLLLETFFFGVDIFDSNRAFTIGLTTDIAGIIEGIQSE